LTLRDAADTLNHPMPIRLIRHAKAGSRHDWTGSDLVRPLTKRGWEQAHGLADRLVVTQPTRILSSPYTRCVQTVEPLAAALGVDIEPTDLLREGARFEAVIELLLTLPDNSVLCSHGDVIPDVIAALDRRHVDIFGLPDWRKAATWVITRDGDSPEAQIVSATTEPPPTQ
jgi:8-oxo-dGTP diphosphatase